MVIELSAPAPEARFQYKPAVKGTKRDNKSGLKTALLTHKYLLYKPPVLLSK